MKKFYKIPSVLQELFDNKIELLSSATEIFELELAYLEYRMLDKTEYLERTAYAKSFNGKNSLHFLRYSEMSEEISKNRTSTANLYFKNRLFSTGYATHGLFPYRGKFHPQLIKGIINILGIKKGETILDPMAGSGTTNIEASLLGINSYAIDISPFCQFMIKTKYEALKIDLDLLNSVKLDVDKLFNYFSQKNILQKIEKIETGKKEIYQLALLAYLDALGYSNRIESSNHQKLFVKVLNRYVETVKSILSNKFFDKHQLGNVSILPDSDALNIKLPDNSIDGIITSPPYSFAIDYVENDKDQLEYLGYDTNELKQNLIGLKGKTKLEKLENYFSDMNKFLGEASRVLKQNKFFVLIVGSNTNQTGGIRLEENIINSAKNHRLKLVKSILKPIKGIRNTMTEEYILFFEKE
ncbi:MAG: DNA methyltransferase C1 [Bacteroidia bacterium]|nr:MAG: DNA methyltransferase C1 [Bacteroidia bacterium]